MPDLTPLRFLLVTVAGFVNREQAQAIARYSRAMMSNRLHAALFLAGLAPLLPAQQTWVVDPNGGGNFTTLQAAVTASGPWDTILLPTWGMYANVVVDKPLSILSDSWQRPYINGLTVLQGTVPGQVVVLRGVWVHGGDFQAPVTIEDASLSSVRTSAAFASIHRCTIANFGYPNSSAIFVQGGDVRLTDCTLDGTGYSESNFGGLCQVSGGTPAMFAAGNVTLANCTVTGAAASPSFCNAPTIYPARTAIRGTGTLRVSGGSLTGGQGFGASPGAAPVEWTGTFEFDPSVQFSPATTIGSTTFLPRTGGQGASPGGTIACRAESGPALPAVVVASLGARGPTTLPVGTVWIDPVAFVVLVIGVTDGAGQLAASIPVPPSVPRGLSITVQSAVAPSTSGPLTAGVPVVVHVL